jgi:hypothetical protein
MKLILIIGTVQQGKTPYIQRMIRGKRCFIYDWQNEYGKRPKYAGGTPIGLSDNIRDYRARDTRIDYNLFIQSCMKKVDTICVFEDATGFFEGRVDGETRKLISSRAFTRNTYVFVFHSINSVPPRFVELSNYVILFRTADNADKVERKCPELLPAFLELKRNKKLPYKGIKIA